MYKFSYIIPYRKSTASRERNMRLVLKWLESNFTDFEIIIAELDDVPRFDKGILPNHAKHVFSKFDGIFNRSAARNMGALNAESDILVFADNDVIMNPEEFLYCIEKCYEEYEAVNPFKICIDLTESEIDKCLQKENDFSMIYQIAKSKKAKDVSRHRVAMPFAGANLIIRKKSFFAIGGWPLEMVGWGAEDNTMSYKIDRFLAKHTYSNYIYHIPHERSTYDWYNHPQYKNNCDKMKHIMELPDDKLIEYCNICREKILSSDISRIEESERKEWRAVNIAVIRDRIISEDFTFL